MSWRNFDNNGVPSWVCEHGVIHPDKKKIAVKNGFDKRLTEEQSRHNCDGCCNRPDFPGAVNIDMFNRR